MREIIKNTLGIDIHKTKAEAMEASGADIEPSEAIAINELIRPYDLSLLIGPSKKEFGELVEIKVVEKKISHVKTFIAKTDLPLIYSSAL